MVRVSFLVLLASGAVAFAAAAEVKHSSAEGKYSVEFPAKPMESIQVVDSPIGKLKMHIAAVEAKKDLGCMVIYNDYPEVVGKENPQALLQRVREGTKGSSGKVLEDKEITYGKDKLPGRAYLLDKGGSFTRVRAYLNGKRLYQVIIVGANKDEVASKVADNFMESFQITE